MVCFDDVYSRVEDFDYLANFLELVFRYKILLVDDKCRTEFNLLNKEAFDVFFSHCFLCEKFVTACKFIDKTCGINNADNVVKLSVFDEFKFLGDWHWFTYAGSFDHDVVEFSALDEIFDVLDHIALEGAAEASVCHRNDACCVCDLCSISNEFCINVYFANVIDDDCNFISFLIGKNLVHESCFSCSEISAEQCDRCRFLCHDDPLKKSLCL